MFVAKELFGEMPERLNGTVSKTVVFFSGTVGSNPTPSASPLYTKSEGSSNPFKHTVLSRVNYNSQLHEDGKGFC